MYMVYVWLAIIAAGLILEAIEAGTLVTIWFSVGAVIPLILSLFGITELWYIILQLIIFGIVTILCLIFLRKIAKKTLFKNVKEKTNLDALIGKKFKVISADNDVCYIKINGIEYRAIAEDEANLEVEDLVEVIKLEGNKVIVKKV